MSIFRLAATFLPRKLSIFDLHRALPRVDPLTPETPTTEAFEALMVMLKARFNFLPLREAHERLVKNSLPPAAACLTFDDGYIEKVTEIMPVLLRHKLPGTFFISTGYLNGGMMFNDVLIEAARAARGPELDLSSMGLGRHPVSTVAERIQCYETLIPQVVNLPVPERQARVMAVAEKAGAQLPERLMMTPDQVLQAHRAGIEIGAHTVHHPILAHQSDAEAKREIEQSKSELQDIVGEPVRTFAYPRGKPFRDYVKRDVGLVRTAGFDCALSTAWGAAHSATDAFQLPRFMPHHHSPLRFEALWAQNLWREPQVC